MVYAHNAVTEFHGFEHFLIYGLAIFALTVAVKLICRV